MQECANAMNYLKLTPWFIMNELSRDVFDAISLFLWYRAITFPISMINMRVKSRGSGMGDTGGGNKSC